MQNNTTKNHQHTGKTLSPHKESLPEKMRNGLEKTGNFQEPDSKSGISGISTTSFISSALLTAIGFGLRDGFFQKFNSGNMLTGILLLIVNVFLALILIVSGVVIFQTIADSKKSDRNIRIYWLVLMLVALALILVL